MKETITTLRLYLPEDTPDDRTQFLASVTSTLSSGDLESAAEQTSELRHLLTGRTLETMDSRRLRMRMLPESAEEEVTSFIVDSIQSVIFGKDHPDITYGVHYGIPYAEASIAQADDSPTTGYDMISAIRYSGALVDHTEDPEDRLEETILQAIAYCQNKDTAAAIETLRETLEQIHQ